MVLQIGLNAAAARLPVGAAVLHLLRGPSARGVVYGKAGLFTWLSVIPLFFGIFGLRTGEKTRIILQTVNKNRLFCAEDRHSGGFELSPL